MAKPWVAGPIVPDFDSRGNITSNSTEDGGAGYQQQQCSVSWNSCLCGGVWLEKDEVGCCWRVLVMAIGRRGLVAGRTSPITAVHESGCFVVTSTREADVCHTSSCFNGWRPISSLLISRSSKNCALRRFTQCVWLSCDRYVHAFPLWAVEINKQTLRYPHRRPAPACF